MPLCDEDTCSVPVLQRLQPGSWALDSAVPLCLGTNSRSQREGGAVALALGLLMLPLKPADFFSLQNTCNLTLFSRSNLIHTQDNLYKHIGQLLYQ